MSNKIKYSEVTEELLQYLKEGCEYLVTSDSYYRTSLERLALIRANFQDGLTPRELVIINAIYRDVHTVIQERDKSVELNKQATEGAKEFMNARKGAYRVFTAAEFRAATKLPPQEGGKSGLTDAEVAALPMNFSDQELMSTPDNILNRKELIRKATLMFA